MKIFLVIQLGLDATGAEGPGPNSRTSRLPSFLEIFRSDSLKKQRGGGILSQPPLEVQPANIIAGHRVPRSFPKVSAPSSTVPASGTCPPQSR